MDADNTTAALVGPWPARETAKGWDLVGDHVARACERSGGRYSAVSIFESLLQGNMQLWTIEKQGRIVACLVTEVISYATGLQVMSFVIVTGARRKEWVGLWPLLAEWAKGMGCQRIESWARPGWSREMKRHGWVETHRLIERDL